MKFREHDSNYTERDYEDQRPRFNHLSSSMNYTRGQEEADASFPEDIRDDGQAPEVLVL